MSMLSDQSKIGAQGSYSVGRGRGIFSGPRSDGCHGQGIVLAILHSCISLMKSGERVIFVALAAHHLRYPADGRRGCHRKKTLFLSGQQRPDKCHPQKSFLCLCAEHGWGNEAVSTPKGKRIVLWSSPGFRCKLVRHEGGTWLRTAFGTIPFHPRLDTGTRPCPIDRQVESISSAEQGRYFGGDLLGLGFLQILHLRLKMVDAPVLLLWTPVWPGCRQCEVKLQVSSHSKALMLGQGSCSNAAFLG